jgi:hypothetical protein
MNLTSLHPRILTVVAIILGGFVTSCEDPVPNDYTPEVVVEARLIVDEPITDIRIYLSQPLNDTFTYANAVITDAQAVVRKGAVQIPLEYIADADGGFYRAVDTTIDVEPETTYELELRTQGRVITGKTTTPRRIAWQRELPAVVRYVGLSNETRPIPDSLKVTWTNAGSGVEYLITMENLDTAGYGIYLSPPTTDSNARLRPRDREFDDDTQFANERTRFAFVQGPNVFSWGAFKWFGKHEFTVFAGDKNFMDNVKQVTFGGRQINPNLQSVTNAIGVFGSASRIRSTTFLLKP